MNSGQISELANPRSSRTPTASGNDPARANYVLTFDGLLSNTTFVDDMREMLATRLDDQIDEVLGKTELDTQLAERKKRLGMTS